MSQAFDSAAVLLENVLEDLKLKVAVPATLKEKPVQHLADMPYSDLVAQMVDLLRSAGIPEDAIRLQAVAVAQRLHLLRAFEFPDKVVERVTKKVAAIVATFPQQLRTSSADGTQGMCWTPIFWPQRNPFARERFHSSHFHYRWPQGADDY